MSLTDSARDLDETRRLLYMALLAPRTKKYELAGTLVNAIRHHQGVKDRNLELRVVSYLEGAPDADGGLERWVRAEIDRCTAALEK